MIRSIIRIAFQTLLLSIFLWGSGICQKNPLFNNITAENGSLPGTLLMDIAQDQNGFLWLGFAGNGLARYDGQFFKTFKSETNNIQSLSNNFIQTVFIDSQDNIWIGTWNGLNLYNRDQDNFTRLLTGRNTGNPIYTIYEDTRSRIWVGLAGLNLLQKSDTGYAITNYSYNENDSTSLSNDLVMSILEDGENKLWIACENGMNLFNEETGDFQRFPPEDDQKIQIQTVLLDRKGQIWLGTYGQGLWQFNPYTGKYTDFYQQINIQGTHNEFVGTIRQMLEDSKGNFWIATDGSGLGILDRANQVLTMYTSDPFHKGSLVHNNTLSLFQDSHSNVWIGTVNGISIVNNRTYDIEKITNHPLEKNSLSDNWVTGILLDNEENFWIATEGGVNHLDRSTGIFTWFQHDPDNPNSLISNKVNCLLKDRSGWIWCGHWEMGITRFHPEQQRYIRYTAENPDGYFLTDINVRRILQDREGNFWFLNDGGVDFLNQQNGETRHFSLPNPRDLIEDKNGLIWIASTSGLRFIDKGNMQFSRVSDRRVMSLTESKNGTIWLATNGDGIVKLDPKTMKEVLINQTNHFPGFFCHGIIEDLNGYLWITSSDGIFKLDPVTGNTQKIISVFGSDNVKFKPYLCSNDGSIHFGTIDGVISFHPDSLQDYPIPESPTFTDFLLFNKHEEISETSTLNAAISEINEITLSHFQNVFTLNYISPYYEEPAGINYAFKLDGFDEDWRFVANQKSATYTNLDAGTYIFRVKASNQNNQWNPEEAAIQITVLPPPWKTWWAYTLYGLVLLSLLYFIYRQIIKREQLRTRMQLDQLQLEKARELDHAKTQFFSNISHEFRTPLTLILGPIKQMYEGTFTGDSRTVLRVVIRNAQRLLHLVNQLLDFTKLEAGGVRLQTSVGDMVEFMRTMFSTFESTAQQRGISYMFQSSVSSLPAYFDRDKMEKVIINLLSNAFKFCKKGEDINLKMIKKNGGPTDRGEGIVEITVEDSGKGISTDKLPHVFDRFYQADDSHSREQEGTGIGLALAKQLVELHYGWISVTSKKGYGSTFIIQLPLGKSHLKEEEIVVGRAYKPLDTTPVEALPLEEPIQKYDTGKGNLPLLLVVEDNEDMRLYLREIMSINYKVIEAFNGENGLDFALEHTPDLIISDVMMPSMDGHQLCQKLKTDERTSHIPVILLTARAGEEAKLEGLETGADDYITKPFSPVELRARVQNLIELRQKLREKFEKNLFLIPNEIQVTSIDKLFLQRAYDILEIHRSDPEFNSDVYAREVGMSRSQLHRKLKALTNYSTGEFIRLYRLNYARELLCKNFGDIAQVSYECGFSSPSYFTDCFKKQFGIVPSEFVKANAEG